MFDLEKTATDPADTSFKQRSATKEIDSKDLKNTESNMVDSIRSANELRNDL